MAWRLQSLYGPIAAAVRSVMASRLAQLRPGEGLDRGRLTVLQVGGHAEALASFLATDTFDYEIFPAAPGNDEQVPERDCDCAVVIDWLPGLSPSWRERSIVELCGAAREGVIVVNAFQSLEVAAASRAINDLHRATRGADHPVLSRQIEFGWPDLEAVRGWLERGFANVEVRPLAHASVWQAVEALALADARIDKEPSTADFAAAVVYPAGDSPHGGHGAYRTMIVAARRPAALELPTRAMSSDATAITTHYAVEAAAHRRALEALSHDMTVEREREREEFRATVASIAAELRELDARAEFLAREIRSRDQIIANQHAVSGETATRLTEAHAQVAIIQAQVANLQAQVAEGHGQIAGLQAQVAEGHGEIAGLQAQVADGHGQIVALQAQVADGHGQIAGLHAQVADREASLAVQQVRMADEATRRAMLEGRFADAQQVAQAHHRFLQSRAGRALGIYTRAKNLLMGRR